MKTTKRMPTVLEVMEDAYAEAMSKKEPIFRPERMAKSLLDHRPEISGHLIELGLNPEEIGILIEEELKNFFDGSVFNGEVNPSGLVNPVMNNKSDIFEMFKALIVSGTEYSSSELALISRHYFENPNLSLEKKEVWEAQTSRYADELSLEVNTDKSVGIYAVLGLN